METAEDHSSSVVVELVSSYLPLIDDGSRQELLDCSSGEFEESAVFVKDPAQCESALEAVMNLARLMLLATEPGSETEALRDLFARVPVGSKRYFLPTGGAVVGVPLEDETMATAIVSEEPSQEAQSSKDDGTVADEEASPSPEVVSEEAEVEAQASESSHSASVPTHTMPIIARFDVSTYTEADAEPEAMEDEPADAPVDPEAPTPETQVPGYCPCASYVRTRVRARLLMLGPALGAIEGVTSATLLVSSYKALVGGCPASVPIVPFVSVQSPTHQFCNDLVSTALSLNLPHVGTVLALRRLLAALAVYTVDTVLTVPQQQQLCMAAMGQQIPEAQLAATIDALKQLGKWVQVHPYVVLTDAVTLIGCLTQPGPLPPFPALQTIKAVGDHALSDVLVAPLEAGAEAAGQEAAEEEEAEAEAQAMQEERYDTRLRSNESLCPYPDLEGTLTQRMDTLAPYMPYIEQILDSTGLVDACVLVKGAADAEARDEYRKSVEAGKRRRGADIMPHEYGCQVCPRRVMPLSQAVSSLASALCSTRDRPPRHVQECLLGVVAYGHATLSQTDPETPNPFESPQLAKRFASWWGSTSGSDVYLSYLPLGRFLAANPGYLVACGPTDIGVEVTSDRAQTEGVYEGVASVSGRFNSWDFLRPDLRTFLAPTPLSVWNDEARQADARGQDPLYSVPEAQHPVPPLPIATLVRPSLVQLQQRLELLQPAFAALTALGQGFQCLPRLMKVLAPPEDQVSARAGMVHNNSLMRVSKSAALLPYPFLRVLLVSAVVCHEEPVVLSSKNKLQASITRVAGILDGYDLPAPITRPRDVEATFLCLCRVGRWVHTHPLGLLMDMPLPKEGGHDAKAWGSVYSVARAIDADTTVTCGWDCLGLPSILPRVTGIPVEASPVPPFAHIPKQYYPPHRLFGDCLSAQMHLAMKCQHIAPIASALDAALGTDGFSAVCQFFGCPKGVECPRTGDVSAAAVPVLREWVRQEKDRMAAKRGHAVVSRVPLTLVRSLLVMHEAGTSCPDARLYQVLKRCGILSAEPVSDKKRTSPNYVSYLRRTLTDFALIALCLRRHPLLFFAEVPTNQRNSCRRALVVTLTRVGTLARDAFQSWAFVPDRLMVETLQRHVPFRCLTSDADSAFADARQDRREGADGTSTPGAGADSHAATTPGETQDAVNATTTDGQTESGDVEMDGGVSETADDAARPESPRPWGNSPQSRELRLRDPSPSEATAEVIQSSLLPVSVSVSPYHSQTQTPSGVSALSLPRFDTPTHSNHVEATSLPVALQGAVLSPIELPLDVSRRVSDPVPSGPPAKRAVPHE
ncbi:hypothetical protein KIPB_002512 [Kipferlia bialata]|uniref:Uncharacterized protein n=1 Tax=Kipferlia bialata TaxID=797122 RepID=A0A9K3GG70_9EUKA|nr:hypothetical protein KIPB_002512 [Kipferlia bialata]|eukprot:g2512.t1